MAAAKKKPKTTRWSNGDTPIEELEPCDQIAHQIVQQFGDLAPSVERIMDAELSAAQRLHGITIFQASLDSPGDPNRDPRNAIEAALKQPE